MSLIVESAAVDRATDVVSVEVTAVEVTAGEVADSSVCVEEAAEVSTEDVDVSLELVSVANLDSDDAEATGVEELVLDVLVEKRDVTLSPVVERREEPVGAEVELSVVELAASDDELAPDAEFDSWDLYSL